MKHIPVALGFLAAMAAPTFAAAQDCPQFFAGGVPPALVNQALAPRTTPLCNDAYASMASGLTHGPLWSAEHPTAASLDEARGQPREGQFHPDARLPDGDGAQLEDYRRSGFDRGHMTPSGDMPTEEAQDQSFSLANMVPQTAELNRGIWEGIEAAVRHLAFREGEIYVVTGPAYKGRDLQSIGPDQVLVPTFTWKAIYDPRWDGAAAYVCSNTQQPSCETMSVGALERLSGVQPFPSLSEAIREHAMPLPEPRHSPYAREQAPQGDGAVGALRSLLGRLPAP